MTDKNTANLIEAAVISAMLNQNDLIYYLYQQKIELSWFGGAKAKVIFGAIDDLFTNNQTIDETTILHNLNQKGYKTTAQDLSDIKQNHYEIEGLDDYIVELKDYKERRALEAFGKEYEAIKNKDLKTTEKTKLVLNALNKVSNNNENNRHVAKFGFNKVFQAIKSQILDYVNTGFESIDKHILIATGMHVIAGRPGTGKTSLADQIAEYVAVSGGNVLFFSAEMNYEDVMLRTIQRKTGITSTKIKKKELTEHDYIEIEKIGELLSDQLVYNDSNNLEIDNLVNIARIEHQRKNLNLIVIDYIQLLRSGKFKTKYEEVSDISKKISSLAKELKLPIITLAQLNRAIETDGGRKPNLSDLRDSGQIEQDATSVMFIHREKTKVKGVFGAPEEVEIVVAKNRFGIKEVIFKLLFDGKRVSFKEIDMPKFGTPKHADYIPMFDAEKEKESFKF